MAFNPFKILKGLIIQKEGSLTPDKIEITPNGTASTTTTIQSSQTVNRTITLPDATDTLATVTQVNTVQTNLDNHINDATDAHDASAISNVPAGTIAATDVQAAVNELDGDIQGHITDTTDAHDASAISVVPTGNLAATDVQAGLEEIQLDVDQLQIDVADKADKQLANLDSINGTAINTSLVPDSNIAYELGSSTLAWNGLFTNSINPPALSPLNITNNDDAITVDAATDLNLSGTNNVIVTSDVINLTSLSGPVTITSATPIDVNSQIITGVLAPVSASDAVNKEYADSISAGLDPKQAVRVATTASLGGSYATTPSNGRFTGAATTVDGVSLTAGDRVLVKDQVDQKQNGIYVYDGAGQYTRSSDMDGSPSSEVSAGNYTFTTQGTLNSATGYVLTGNGTLTLNTDNLVFTQFSGGSSGASRFLDNLLSPTAINQNLLPSANNTIDIGSSTLNFKDLYADGTLYFNGEVVKRTALTNAIFKSTNASNPITPTGDTQIRSGDNAGAGGSGNISITTGTTVGGTRGNVILSGNTIRASNSFNLAGTTGVAVANQQALSISNSGSTEGNINVTSSDSVNRKILISGAEGLPQAQNLIDNGDAEGKLTSSTSIFVPYADAAQSTPVDGTGGSPNVTTAVTATNPLAGFKSYTLVKDAANRQGQGWSIPFTVNPSNRARVLSIKFDYIVDSGTFVAGTSTTDSDVTVYIYDVTNSTLIQPSSFRLLSNSSTIADQFQAEFQTSQSGSSYRLILHVATTSASAYTLKVDNIIVSPSEYVFGTPISDWQSYTPTFQGFGTTTAIEFQYRRSGSDIEIRGKFTAGTTTAVEARISLPSGLTSSNTSVIPSIQESGVLFASNTFAGSASVLIEPSVTYLTLGLQGAGSGGLTKQLGNAYNTGATFTIMAKVPIAGWSSSVQMADSTSTRIVSFVASKATNESVTANVTNITFGNVIKDTHAAWNGSQYTVPVAGDYIIGGSSYSTTSAYSISVYVNGTRTFLMGTSPSTGNVIPNNVIVPNLKVGDILSFRSGTSTTIAGNATVADASIISISRISGPAQIASSETVAAKYTTTSATAITNSIASITYGTKEFDTHNAMSGSTYTVPINGIYEVSGAIQLANNNWTTGTLNLQLYVDGVANSQIAFFTQGTGSGAASTIGAMGSCMVALNAGQALTFRASQSQTASINLSGSAILNFIQIKRIGNRG